MLRGAIRAVRAEKAVCMNIKEPIYAVCGLNCALCVFLEEGKCKGCHNMGGHTRFGDCEWFDCCKNRQGLDHCGQCDGYPCGSLKRTMTKIDRLYTFDVMRKLAEDEKKSAGEK